MTAPVLVGPQPPGGGPVPSLDWDDALADIGDRVRAEREARGWSQTQLARTAGVGLNTIRRLERGDASMRCFVQACTALQIPVGMLLSPQWQKPEPKPTRIGVAAARPIALSPRQTEVLREAASGDSLAAVGARLGLDVGTVGSTLSRVYRRLGVACLPRDERRAAAAQVALKHGLFTPGNRTS
ncbi:helix-turn-helix domain-containing protein [Streptomyces cylindrosporus]|uniref:Helix-turn-helix domain-containing protein n=1 Tax=Streptomyces cylindrosporus TaxID=2927583 RepID=A0ABS9YPG1_9ACTN|nr:helix-turn-helix domain-containing protein [Streptomyces cylindrosporus]MCI3279158.1 helix-turn-helix domain-containing protein [Streptomyces cylindrosporus]